MWDRRADFLSNHDGDTVTMVLDQGFYDTKQINIRLANVWAPELKQAGGVETRNFVTHWFEDRFIKGVWSFVVVTYRTKAGREIKTFDRYVADVLSVDGTSHLNSDVMKFIADMGYDGGVGSPEKQARVRTSR